MSKCRKYDGSQHVKEEYDGNRLCDFLIVCFYDRGSGGDGGTAADRRSYADQSRDVGRCLHNLVQHIGDEQRRRYGTYDNRQRLLSGLQDDV